MIKLFTKLSDLKWYKALPIWYVIMAAFVFLGYKLITIGTEGTIFNDNAFLLKISLTLAVPFSLMAVFMAKQSKRNEEFWDRAHKVEEEIDAAETKDEILRIFKEEISYETGELRRLVNGLPHLDRVRQLYKVLETKAKYVK